MRKFPLLLFFLCAYSSCVIHAASSLRSDTIDIRKTIIDFTITDFIGKNIQAKAVLDIRCKMNNISEIHFDLEGLITDSVVSNNQQWGFQQNGAELQITPLAPFNLNDTALITVYYHGIPIADAAWGGFSYVGNYGFQMGVGFNAQPHSFGRTWHPCFDNFVERSDYEFYITTTNDKMAVCNGLLIDTVQQQNNTIRWHWKLNEQIPSYLASVAVCNYVWVKKILNGNNGNTDAWIACETVDTNKVNGSFAHLQESFTMLEENFGTYQWPRVGYSLVPFNAGAMEHATNIHIGKPFVDGSLTYETLIAHELSHHWWGDLVTCSSAGDMWLNEGFASYCELLHQEYTYGADAYRTAMQANHFNVLNKAHISDDGYRSVANMDSMHTYGTTVYHKGADMIHTLRSYVGDSLFFNGLTAFLQAYKFKDINTQQLRDFMSNYSGIDLIPYFENWILAPGFTHFSIDSQHVVQNGNVYETTVFIRQRKHKSPTYYSNVPLEIGFYDAQMNLHVHQLMFNGRCMEFQVSLPFEPLMIVVDPNARLSDAITEETKIVKSTGLINMTQAKIRIYPKAIVNAGDSTLLRVEHSWIAPDRFKSAAAANGYILCDTRYWKVDAINLNNLSGILQFNYDGGANNSYLDSAWVNNTEDSIHLFYRKDATEEWQIANDSLKVGGLNDKLGAVYAKEIKAGEYCLGIKKSNFVDPVVTDAPTGGCGFATIVQQILSNAASVIVYPNPAKDEIKIRFSDSKSQAFRISLYNISGLKVKETIQDSHAREISWQLPNLNAGIYYLDINGIDNGYRVVKKVVIE